MLIIEVHGSCIWIDAPRLVLLTYSCARGTEHCTHAPKGTANINDGSYLIAIHGRHVQQRRVWNLSLFSWLVTYVPCNVVYINPVLQKVLDMQQILR